MQAYDSVWRPALFAKPTKLGFGDKTLSLIESMYTNDSIRFLINGKYTDELFLTQGVKQGMINSRITRLNFELLGCNLSPLLFSLFINNLESLLNTTGLGINLESINISGIFFADDLIILGQSKTALDTLMMITKKIFKNHHLSISKNKI